MKFYITFVLLFLTALMEVKGQSYQVRLIDKGNNVLGVQMRITAGAVPTTNEFIVDLKWGIRWLVGANIDLGNLIQNPTGTYNGVKSNSELQKTVNGLTYEFQSFTVDPTPYRFPITWETNTWVDIVSMPVTGSLPTAAFEICPMGFDGTTDRNFNVNLTDYTPEIQSGTSLILPLELIRFEAKISNNPYVLLDWQTANEQNVAFFEIERSADAKKFPPLSKVKAENGLQQVYTFEDKQPLENISYYRLKMVDKDGSYQYSQIQSVALTAKKPIINISPNPLKSGGLLHVKAATEEPSNLILTDALGRVIVQSTFKNEVWLSTQGWASGVYFLNWQAKTQQEIKKIIIE